MTCIALHCWYLPTSAVVLPQPTLTGLHHLEEQAPNPSSSLHHAEAATNDPLRERRSSQNWRLAGPPALSPSGAMIAVLTFCISNTLPAILGFERATAAATSKSNWMARQRIVTAGDRESRNEGSSS